MYRESMSVIDYKPGMNRSFQYVTNNISDGNGGEFLNKHAYRAC